MKLKEILYRLQIVERLNKRTFKKLTDRTIVYDGYHFIQIGKKILWMDEIDYADVAERLNFWEVPYKDVAIFDQESTREWGKIRSWNSDVDKYYQEINGG